MIELGSIRERERTNSNIYFKTLVEYDNTIKVKFDQNNPFYQKEIVRLVFHSSNIILIPLCLPLKDDFKDILNDQVAKYKVIKIYSFN